MMGGIDVGEFIGGDGKGRSSLGHDGGAGGLINVLRL